MVSNGFAQRICARWGVTLEAHDAALNGPLVDGGWSTGDTIGLGTYFADNCLEHTPTQHLPHALRVAGLEKT
jgi:hypothetical protein